jgi:hypothetical protein
MPWNPRETSKSLGSYAKYWYFSALTHSLEVSVRYRLSPSFNSIRVGS